MMSHLPLSDPVSPEATTARTDPAAKIDWVKLEESLSGFLSQPPAGGPDLLGDGVLTDAIVDGWLRTMNVGATAGRPFLQLIAVFGKLMIYEMPVRRPKSFAQNLSNLVAWTMNSFLSY